MFSLSILLCRPLISSWNSVKTYNILSRRAVLNKQLRITEKHFWSSICFIRIKSEPLFLLVKVDPFFHHVYWNRRCCKFLACLKTFGVFLLRSTKDYFQYCQCCRFFCQCSTFSCNSLVTKVYWISVRICIWNFLRVYLEPLLLKFFCLASFLCFHDSPVYPPLADQFPLSVFTTSPTYLFFKLVKLHLIVYVLLLYFTYCCFHLLIIPLLPFVNVWNELDTLRQLFSL